MWDVAEREQHLVEHRGGQPAGEGVVRAHVVAAEEGDRPAVGRGEDDPVADDASAAGRAANRRVIILVGEATS